MIKNILIIKICIKISLYFFWMVSR